MLLKIWDDVTLATAAARCGVTPDRQGNAITAAIGGFVGLFAGEAGKFMFSAAQAHHNGTHESLALIFGIAVFSGWATAVADNVERILHHNEKVPKGAKPPFVKAG